MLKKIIIAIFTTIITMMSYSVSNAEWISVQTYAYTANEATGLTASGEVPYEGGVACNFLPLGTKVIINDIEYVVNDRSGTPGIIDIFMISYEAAINYGSVFTKVYVVR